MWNVTNLYFSSTPKDLGYYYGVKIYDLIKHYWLAAGIFTGNNFNIIRIVTILTFSIAFIYFAFRLWGKYSKKRYIQKMWNEEVKKTRCELTRLFYRDIVKQEPEKTESVLKESIQLATTFANWEINQGLQLGTMQRVGINEEILKGLQIMNINLKKSNDEIDDIQQGASEFRKQTLEFL